MRFSADRMRVVVMLVVTALLGGCAMPMQTLSGVEIANLSGPLEVAAQTLPEPVASILDEHEAVSRAVRYNAQIRAQEMAAAVAAAKVSTLSASMLPSLVAQSSVYGRSSQPLARSSQSTTYTTSSDARSTASDMTLSWSILDFGLSYVRSLQAADRAAREAEEVRRVTARVVEETRTAYWRAAAYQHLVAKAGPIEADVRAALRVSMRAGQDSRLDVLETLGYQRDTLNLMRELNQLRIGLSGAEQQLKALIGVPQSVELRLRPTAAPDHRTFPSASLDSDFRHALANRREIRQHVLDMRITDQEINAAVLQLLPGITLSRSLEHDTNSFLAQANWVSWGTKIAWNLMNLARLPRDIELVEAQQELNRSQALATAVTIWMQVGVARARLAVHRRVALDARQLRAVQDRLLTQVRAAVRVGAVAPQALAKERLAQLLAEVRHKQAVADLHGAIAAYATSLGDDEAVSPLSPQGVRASGGPTRVRSHAGRTVGPSQRLAAAVTAGAR